MLYEFLKYFCRKNWQTIRQFLLFYDKTEHDIEFQEKKQLFFPRKLVKIAITTLTPSFETALNKFRVN
jgi:hypothetical protein